MEKKQKNKVTLRFSGTIMIEADTEIEARHQFEKRFKNVIELMHDQALVTKNQINKVDNLLGESAMAKSLLGLTGKVLGKVHNG